MKKSLSPTAEEFARGVQLRHLRCFVAVAQERHLARAAERLALSQPAVSKTLAELEALAGQRLVERGGAGRRGIQGLSLAGEQFLAHALRMLEALEAGARSVAPAAGVPPQRLRMGVLPSVAPVIAGAVADLRRRAPGLNLQVHTDANATLVAALRAGELDLVAGRMTDPSLMAGLSFELLYQEPLMVVARPGHALARGRPAAQDVLRHPLVIYAEGTVPRHHTERWLAGLGLRLPVGVTQTLDLALARALVLQSDALWFTPLGAVADELADKRLARVRLAMDGSDEPVGLLLRIEAEPTPEREVLVGLLRALVPAQSRVARRWTQST